MRKLNKKALYEKIMRNISKEVKSVLNEEEKREYGRFYGSLNSDLIKSFIKADYNKNNTDTDTWGEPLTVGCFILGNFKPIKWRKLPAQLMVGCVQTIKKGQITAVTGDGDICVLDLESGFKRISQEQLHDLFSYDRLAPINRNKR